MQGFGMGVTGEITDWKPHMELLAIVNLRYERMRLDGLLPSESPESCERLDQELPGWAFDDMVEGATKALTIYPRKIVEAVYGERFTASERQPKPSKEAADSADGTCEVVREAQRPA